MPVKTAGRYSKRLAFIVTLVESRECIVHERYFFFSDNKDQSRTGCEEGRVRPGLASQPEGKGQVLLMSTSHEQTIGEKTPCGTSQPRASPPM